MGRTLKPPPGSLGMHTMILLAMSVLCKRVGGGDVYTLFGSFTQGIYLTVLGGTEFYCLHSFADTSHIPVDCLW